MCNTSTFSNDKVRAYRGHSGEVHIRKTKKITNLQWSFAAPIYGCIKIIKRNR